MGSPREKQEYFSFADVWEGMARSRKARICVFSGGMGEYGQFPENKSRKARVFLFSGGLGVMDSSRIPLWQHPQLCRVPPWPYRVPLIAGPLALEDPREIDKSNPIST